MRFTFLKNVAVGRKIPALLFIVVTACLFSASFADVHRKLMGDSGLQLESLNKEFPKTSVLHPRILAVKTNDYGSYDPSPSLEKPPFKLIPN